MRGVSSILLIRIQFWNSNDELQRFDANQQQQLYGLTRFDRRANPLFVLISYQQFVQGERAK